MISFILCLHTIFGRFRKSSALVNVSSGLVVARLAVPVLLVVDVLRGALDDAVASVATLFIRSLTSQSW